MREPLGRATVLAVALVAASILTTAPAAGAADDVVDAPGAAAIIGESGAPLVEEPAEEPAGDVAYDVWYDRWGQSLADVPVGADPWGTWDLTGVLESPVDTADQYAMRMRTLLTPTESGSYRFYVSGDDDVRLFLDPTGDDPAEARLVAYVAGWTTYRQFDRFASQRTEWFELQAGQPYYVEVIGKEGSFGDHFSVAWEQAGGFGPTMVPGEVLESTMLGSGGWRTATPSGLPSSPAPMTDPGWQSVAGVESLAVSWNPVDGAEWYEVRLEGSGEAREVVVSSPSVEFVGLVPETRYLVEVAPANPAARMPAASTVRVTLAGEYPPPVAPTPGTRASVSYDRWDTGWWTLTSVPFGLPPASSGTTTTGFETSPMQGDNHAARLRAVLTPATTGAYTFFLSADDDARLLFNPDGVDAKGAVPIASVAGWTEQYQWDRYQSQRSATFQLHAGRSYYLEAISVHALGLDHMEVGWSRDGGAITVVPNEVLSPTPAGGGGWRTDPSSLPHVPGVPAVDADGGEHEVVVGWTAPTVDANHGAATFYEVRLLDDAGELRSHQWVTETSTVFDGLEDQEEYEVVVVAWNATGPGGPASADVETGDDEVDDGGAAPLPPTTGEHLLDRHRHGTVVPGGRGVGHLAADLRRPPLERFRRSLRRFAVDQRNAVLRDGDAARVGRGRHAGARPGGVRARHRRRAPAPPRRRRQRRHGAPARPAHRARAVAGEGPARRRRRRHDLGQLDRPPRRHRRRDRGDHRLGLLRDRDAGRSRPPEPGDDVVGLRTRGDQRVDVASRVVRRRRRTERPRPVQRFEDGGRRGRRRCGDPHVRQPDRARARAGEPAAGGPDGVDDARGGGRGDAGRLDADRRTLAGVRRGTRRSVTGRAGRRHVEVLPGRVPVGGRDLPPLTPRTRRRRRVAGAHVRP